MKNKILILSSATLMVVAVFTACQKDKSPTSDNTTQVSLQSDDQARVSSESEAVANDAAFALEVSPSFSGRLASAQSDNLSCDATITYDSVSNPRTVTITYSGSCLGTRTRSGVVKISMAEGVHWKDAGASVTLTFQNFKVTRLSDNKSITINGTQTYTNVSGGLLINLPILQTVVHTISSDDMSITFDDNTSRAWHIAEKRVFTWENNSGVITTTGNHTEGNDLNVAEWGTNRFGQAFTSSTVTPVVIRQDCNFRVVSGQIKHVTPLVTATATFGLDASGSPTSCPGTNGHYYFKVIWTGPGGNSLTVIMPY